MIRTVLARRTPDDHLSRPTILTRLQLNRPVPVDVQRRAAIVDYDALAAPDFGRGPAAFVAVRGMAAAGAVLLAADVVGGELGLTGTAHFVLISLHLVLALTMLSVKVLGFELAGDGFAFALREIADAPAAFAIFDYNLRAGEA